MGQNNCCGCRKGDDARKTARMTAGGDDVLYYQPSANGDIERAAGYTHYYQESALPPHSNAENYRYLIEGDDAVSQNLYKPSVRDYESTVYRPMESRQVHSGVLVSYINGQGGDDSE